MEKTRKAALLNGDTQYFSGVPCKHGHIAARRAKTGECLDCRYIALSKWRKENPQKVKQHNDTQYARHSESLKARSRRFNELNSEVVNAKKREYQKKNLHIFAANNAKRDAAKLQRTPAWLTEDDKWMMSQVYELALLREKIVGGKWHVDHIIPLQGKLVSGLHVINNLQVIPAKLNRSKSNNYKVT
jgi:hypothetical protein